MKNCFTENERKLKIFIKFHLTPTGDGDTIFPYYLVPFVAEKIKRQNILDVHKSLLYNGLKEKENAYEE